MLRPVYKISIQQIPTPKWKDRNLSFDLDFITEGEVSSGWETHTNNCVLKFPKNIKLESNSEGIFTSGGTNNLILGGSGTQQSPNVELSLEGTPENVFIYKQITIPPLIMKGDIVTVNYGYLCRKEESAGNIGLNLDFQLVTGGEQIVDGVEIEKRISTEIDLFQGYVSAVNSDTPIEIEMQDNYYLLKRVPFDSTVWNKKTSGNNTSLYALMQHILDLTNAQFNSKNSLYPKLTLLDIPSSITAQFSLGYLDIGELTCAQVLDKLKNQYHFQSTFRGNVLRFGFPIYIDSDISGSSSINQNPTLVANSKNFFCFRDIFNEQNQLVASANIFPSHDLKYSNKDDIIISATVECAVINEISGEETKLGGTKTKKSKLKTFIYWDIPTGTFKDYDMSKQGSKIPQIDIGGEGERHQFFYPVDKSKPNPKYSDLVKLGIEHLQRYHYTGFKGSFTTFGFPYVQWNDNINLEDPIYSDRNGQYKVKEVKYKFGLKGISQEIKVDYRINIKPPVDVGSIFLM